MPTDPLTGSRYPAFSASPAVHQDIQNAVFDLSDNTIAGPFTTTTARDAAYAAWVTAGGTMRSGLTCHTTSDDRYWTYDGAAWQYLGGAPPSVITFPAVSGWAGIASYAKPGYYKDGSGQVHGSGALTNTVAKSAGATVATLPVGYRPLNAPQALQVMATTTGGTSRLDISTAGLLIVVGSIPINTVFFLDTLKFNPDSLTAGP